MEEDNCDYIPKSTTKQILRNRYCTSLDARGYLPVYEYKLGDYMIMWDRQTGDVFLTGIWKLLGYNKADLMRLVQLNPKLPVKKIRGGLLKIQGTWIPFSDARKLCIHIAWTVRQDLTPLFGTQFMHECLDPLHPRYGDFCLERLQLSKSSFKNFVDSTSAIQQRQQRQSHQHSMHISQLLNNPPDQVTPFDSFRQTTTIKDALYDSKIDYHAKSGKYYDNENVKNGIDLDAHSDGDDDIDDHNGDDHDGAVPDTPVTYCHHKWTFQVIPVTSHDGSPIDRVFDKGSFYTTNVSRSTLPIYGNIGSSSSVDHLLDYTLPSTAAEDTQDMVDIIKATIQLQLISNQGDDDVRQIVPSKIVLGDKEFSVCWD